MTKVGSIVQKYNILQTSSKLPCYLQKHHASVGAYEVQFSQLMTVTPLNPPYRRGAWTHARSTLRSWWDRPAHAPGAAAYPL